MTAALLQALEHAVGSGSVLVGDDQAPFLAEWRRRYTSAAAAVVLPNSTREVVAVVHACREHGAKIVPQGGNTGLVGGAVSGSDDVIVNLSRMRAIRDIDPVNGNLLADAGVTLAAARAAAADQDRLLALDLSSSGTCQLGGNVSTSAGGVNVLRYGGMREQVLGLEVVLPSGEVLDALAPLHKNTAGLDLKQCFIGAEGTLGIVTGVNVRLFALPEKRQVVWLSAASVADIVAVGARLRQDYAAFLAAFELVPEIALQLVKRHQPATRSPTETGGVHALVEIHGGAATLPLDALEQDLAALLAACTLTGALVAQDERQAEALWAIRHGISDAQRHAGISIKHDVAVPLSVLDPFISETSAALHAHLPGVRIVCFGHVGDGNLHFNLSQPEGISADAYRAEAEALSDIVHAAVWRFGGTVSAEHGIGLAKRGLLERQVSPAALTLMRQLKLAWDPECLMNPGKILRDNH